MKQNEINSGANELFNLIRLWAEERGLYDKGDIKTQYCKLGEEFGELGRAIIKNDQTQMIDAIGDIVVVLTNLTKQAGDHFMNECEICKGEGTYTYEDKVGDLIHTDCDTCAHGLTIEECIQIAYDEIKERKGSMKNGSFVKEPEIEVVFDIDNKVEITKSNTLSSLKVGDIGYVHGIMHYKNPTEYRISLTQHEEDDCTSMDYHIATDLKLI